MKNLLNSFAFRMWFIFSIIGLCLSIPLSYYYNNINYNLLEKHAIEELEGMGRASSLSIKVAIKSSDLSILQETIAQISEDNKYAFIALLEQTDEGYTLFKCFPDSLAINRPYYDSTAYYLQNSVLDTELIKGKIILGISKQDSVKQLSELNQPIWQLTLLANITLLLLSSLFFVLVTNPIRKASRFAAQLSQSNYDFEIKASKGKNEISILNNSLITLKQNLIQHKQTNDNLVNNLTSEIEKQTEEITFKSQLQQLLIKISNDFSATSTSDSSITLKVQESLGVINDFIDSNYAMVIKFDKDKGIYLYAKSSNNPDFFLKKTEFRLEDSECNELKTLFSDRNSLQVNDPDNSAVCKVIGNFIANPNKPMMFKIVNPDLSLGGFIVFEEINKESKRLHSQEVQKLIKVFIEMLVNVDLRYLQDVNLNDLKESLEVKVLERTEQLRKNEQKLEKSLEKEKELGVLKTSFVSMASHQFKTPLAVIQSNAELYEMLAATGKIIELEKFEKITGRITGAISVMTELINEVLVLGRVTSGNIVYNPEKTDLVNFCEKITEEFNSVQSDGRIIDFVAEGEPYKLQLDPKLLTHSLSNLISNAFKYSEGKKNPELRIHFAPKEVVLSVKDYGLGIPEAEHLKLFTPFFRANNAHAIKGSGLGLNIAKEYVEVNKGKIAATSVMGEGSCFEITFKR